MPMEGAPWLKPVWMLMAALILQRNLCHAEDQITVDPPRNIEIIDPGHLGQLYINWTPPASLENSTNCSVRFQLQFFNTYEDEWTTIRTRQQSYKAQFDLEKDVHVRVQTILEGRCSGFKDIKSRPAEVLLKPPAKGLPGSRIKGLQCIFHQKEYMNCTWDNRDMKNPLAKYHLYFWHRKMNHAKECPKYFETHGRRSGCRFSWHSLLEFAEFNICVNGSSEGKPFQPAYFSLQLQNHVKPGVINTLSVGSNPKGAVSLEWAPPKGRIPVACLEFQVESRSEDTEGLMVRYLTRDTSFMASTSDPCNSVCFRVRSRVHEYCSDESFWSEWSNPHCLSEKCKFTSDSASNKA